MAMKGDIRDVIMERPKVFKASGEVLYLYPVTLGKMYLLQGFASRLGISSEGMRVSLNLEMLRVVEEHRQDVCELLAYMTARNDYYSVFDAVALEKRRDILSAQEDADLASLLMVVLTEDRTEKYMHELGIDAEQRNIQKVLKVKRKSDKNTFTFGGVSVFGALLDVAMERYKMTKRQVVWEMDYTSLRLLMADKVSTLYVTDEERRRVHISSDRTRINGDDKASLLRAIQSQSWE